MKQFNYDATLLIRLLAILLVLFIGVGQALHDLK